MDEKRYPPYVMLNPAADRTESYRHQPGDLTAEDAAEPEEGPDDTAPIPDLPAPVPPQAAEVVEEEYIQE